VASNPRKDALSRPPLDMMDLQGTSIAVMPTAGDRPEQDSLPPCPNLRRTTARSKVARPAGPRLSKRNING